MSHSDFHIVIFGATSFVGRLICHYLLENYGLSGEIRWAAAGRSREKLEQLKRELGAGAERLDLIVADADRPEELKALCGQADVVLSTVGPYALYGEPLVKACVESGTDYCDLTGEVQWIRNMLEKYEDKARESGARIVHCCGFDSIPSDLGVHFLQRRARETFGKPCERVKLRVRVAKGGFSGGTVASLLNVIEEASRNRALRRLLADPYALCVGRTAGNVGQPEVKSATYDPDFHAWTAPFVMAAINTRVVHRSNALADGAYGAAFRYDEAMLTGAGLKGWAAAQGITAAMGAFMLGAAVKPTRMAMEKLFLPAPGEGPSPQAQQNGFYDLRLHGTTADGETMTARVTGDGDPGYRSTSRMISEAALCLAQDTPRDEKPGGFWTPATALGDRLIERLENKAGVRFTLT